MKKFKRYWRLPTVLTYTQRRRSAINRDPSFPQKVRLGPKTMAWVSAEVIAWARGREADR